LPALRQSITMIPSHCIPPVVPSEVAGRCLPLHPKLRSAPNSVSLSSSATRTASWMGREILKMPTTNLSKKLACFGNTYFLETSSPKTDIRLDC